MLNLILLFGNNFKYRILLSFCAGILQFIFLEKYKILFFSSSIRYLRTVFLQSYILNFAGKKKSKIFRLNYHFWDKILLIFFFFLSTNKLLSFVLTTHMSQYNLRDGGAGVNGQYITIVMLIWKHLSEVSDRISCIINRDRILGDLGHLTTISNLKISFFPFYFNPQTIHPIH